MKLNKEQTEIILNAFDSILLDPDHPNKILDTISAPTENRVKANKLIQELNIQDNMDIEYQTTNPDGTTNTTKAKFRGFVPSYTYDNEDKNKVVPFALNVSLDGYNTHAIPIDYAQVEFLN